MPHNRETAHLRTTSLRIHKILKDAYDFLGIFMIFYDYFVISMILVNYKFIFYIFISF